MSKADDIFWREFGVILSALALFGIVMFFLARAIAGDAHQSSVNTPRAVAERIAPVASVRVGDPTQIVAAAAPAAMPLAPAGGGQAASEGESVYDGACKACHAAGVAGSPKLDDKAAWEPRIAQGVDALVASVLNGKGAMPAKGGNPSLSEDQIRAAVTWMLEQVQGTGGAATTAAAQAMDSAKEAATAAASAVQTAAEGAAAAVAGAVEKVADAAGQAADKAGSMVAAAAPADEGKPGDQTYNAICLACHATGAANAPKLDDKGAWQTRAATGMDSMVQSVVNGKGAMPPKGGLPSLTEPDIRNAVQYMLDQAGVSAGS